VPHEGELDGEVGTDGVDQRPRPLEQRAGARDLVADQGADLRRRLAGRDVGLGDAEVAQVLAGDVDAAALVVAADVLQQAGEGQAAGQVVGKGVQARIAVAADVEELRSSAQVG
jgi:hypothetical protein